MTGISEFPHINVFNGEHTGLCLVNGQRVLINHLLFNGSMFNVTGLWISVQRTRRQAAKQKQKQQQNSQQHITLKLCANDVFVLNIHFPVDGKYQWC